MWSKFGKEQNCAIISNIEFGSPHAQSEDILSMPFQIKTAWCERSKRPRSVKTNKIQQTLLFHSFSTTAILMSAYLIYRIRTSTEGGNSHGIARGEKWQVFQEQEFDSLEEAKIYVRVKSRECTELPLFIQKWKETSEEDRTCTLEQLIDAFCFDDDSSYLRYRRLFIGKPPIEQIKLQLKASSVHIL